jgi:hypothetical protein
MTRFLKRLAREENLVGKDAVADLLPAPEKIPRKYVLRLLLMTETETIPDSRAEPDPVGDPLMQLPTSGFTHRPMSIQRLTKCQAIAS